MSNFKIGQVRSAGAISNYEHDYSLNCLTQDPIINRMYNKLTFFSPQNKYESILRRCGVILA